MKFFGDWQLWNYLDEWMSLQTFNTRRAKATAIADLLKFLGYPTKSVTAAHGLKTLSLQVATRYLGSLGAKGLSDNSIRTRFYCLRKTYEALRKARFISENVWDDLRDSIPKHTVEVRPAVALEDKEVRKLLNAPNSGTAEGLRDKCIIALLFGAGLRRSEVCALKLSDYVKRDSYEYVKLERTKGHGTEWQAVPPWVGDLLVGLKALRTRDGGEYFFIDYTHKLIQDHINGQTINRILKRYQHVIADGENFTRLHSHSGRATCITHLLRDGATIDEVKKFSRHKSFDMVLKYDRRSRQLADSLAKKVKY